MVAVNYRARYCSREAFEESRPAATGVELRGRLVESRVASCALVHSVVEHLVVLPGSRIPGKRRIGDSFRLIVRFDEMGLGSVSGGGGLLGSLLSQNPELLRRENRPPLLFALLHRRHVTASRRRISNRRQPESVSQRERNGRSREDRGERTKLDDTSTTRKPRGVDQTQTAHFFLAYD